MTRYVFGVGTKVWELQADDFIQAYISMALHIKQNIPVAVYEPQKYGFMPKEVLDANMDVFKPDIVKKIMLTIKDCQSSKSERSRR
ncbi:MAG: hypothetical protein DRI46_12690 [Chloroflexi bacterium]|nr:MAG: hypothetical protein DRI46_12690 [Chloroflexota bacterium]